MSKHKILLGIILFVLGLIGILSILTMEVPLPPEAKEILKDFSNNLNKLEEDIQNNELLKYITDKNEIRYYREYVDTYIKDIMYNNYIKTLTSYVDNDDNDGVDTDDEVEKKKQILERITSIANNKNNKNIKHIIDYNIFKDIKDLNELKERKELSEKEKRYSV